MFDTHYLAAAKNLPCAKSAMRLESNVSKELGFGTFI